MVASFATFGLFWGSWAVMLFNIQHTFSLNDAQLGLLLAVAIAVAGASSAVMAHFCDRVGARRLLWIALFAWSVLLCVLALTHDTWSFGVVLVLVEVAGGSIDTAMNAEASHRLMSSPTTLVRLHALFNTGALTGAAIAALLIHAGVSWRWVWPGIAVVALGVGIWALVTDPGTALGSPTPTGLAGDPHGEHPSRHPLRRLRRDGLLMLLAVFALAEITEGGVDTWGVLYLRNHSGHGRAARGRGLRRGPAGGDHDTAGPAATWSGGSPPGGPSSRAVASPAPASSSSRSPPSRAWPRSAWRSAPAGPRCSGRSS